MPNLPFSDSLLGDISFADKVVSFQPGSKVSSPWNNPSLALGVPDCNKTGSGTTVQECPNTSLGYKGTLVVQFTDNALITSGDSSEDLWVFEIGGAVEATHVYISTDGSNWIDVGQVRGATSGVDIDAFIGAGVVAGTEYRFVKLVDVKGSCCSPYAGADIDAVGAISTVASSSPQITSPLQDTTSPIRTAQANWGDAPQDFGVQQGEETETFGAHTFSQDPSGNRYIVDPVNNRIKILDQSGQFRGNIPVEQFPQDILARSQDVILLEEASVAVHQQGRGTVRQPLTEEIPKVEGYGQGLWEGPNGGLYVCKMQECYQVMDANGRSLSQQEQFDSVMPGYPLSTGQWLRIEWLSAKQAQVLFMDAEQILREVPLQTNDAFGALSFIGEDNQGRLYLEIERITADQYAHLDLWVLDAQGKLLKTKTFPNDYFSTVYKKLSVDKSGLVRQMYSTPQGVKYEEYRLDF